MSTYNKISVSFKFCKSSNGDKLEITNLYALCVSCHSLPNISKKIKHQCQEETVNSKKRARLTCLSNQRFTFSSILSSDIATALTIAVAVAITVAVAIAWAVALARAVAIAIAVAITVADTARYDTIYYTLYPMYSGAAPNCRALARSACKMAHT